MDLVVPYNNLSDKDEVYNTIKEEVGPMLEKFQVKAELKYLDDEIVASGKGFDLVLRTLEDKCTVDLKLSFLLKPLRGQILGSLEKQLKKHI